MATTETAPAPKNPEGQPSEPQVEQLPRHTVKLKKPLQRSCNVKDEKNKICGGHLKRWFYETDIIEQECGDALHAWGPKREVYRCEHCKTLYLPNPADPKKPSVAGKGMVSLIGFSALPKPGQ